MTADMQEMRANTEDINNIPAVIDGDSDVPVIADNVLVKAENVKVYFKGKNKKSELYNFVKKLKIEA